MHEPRAGIKGRREPGYRPGGRPRARLLAAALLLGTLAACKGTFPVMDHDRYAGLTRDDYRAAFEPRPVPPAKAAPGAPIPPLQPLVELPPPPSPAEQKLVSISVDETVPLKDVLIELARKAQVDLELDPRISGGVILTMRNRPLREVIERIADLAGLRYEFQGQTLRIERDEPYHVNYRVDYLLLTRQANSQVETSVNVMGGEQATSGNASSSSISGQSDTNSGRSSRPASARSWAIPHRPASRCCRRPRRRLLRLWRRRPVATAVPSRLVRANQAPTDPVHVTLARLRHRLRSLRILQPRRRRPSSRPRPRSRAERPASRSRRSRSIDRRAWFRSSRPSASRS
jgi:hypothetical protein